MWRTIWITSPSYLHANSTSHTWAFSAIAELVDNAYDPDVKAKQLWIDGRKEAGLDCLEFVDNGNGMDSDCLYRMLSFGYCEKAKYEDDMYHKPIGHYGNGFKSGSMRLGKDAIVFTKHKNTMSTGLLSQTYLTEIQADTVLVPMVTWDTGSKRLVTQDTEDSLKAILKHSLFKTEFQLHNEFKSLAKFETGTKIIIYNLKKKEDGKLELDFENNVKDILTHTNHSEVLDSTSTTSVGEHTPLYRISLREYSSMLFLKPWMQIFIQGEKVKTKYIPHTLSRKEMDFYKPAGVKPLQIRFGFGKSKLDYGLMMYHKNRLIKAFKRVGCQRQPQIQKGGGNAIARGVGVIGVVEVNFLQPIHNKQDFEKSDRYNKAISALGSKLNDYWNVKTNQGTTDSDGEKPDSLWAQCDSCLKWRRLPVKFSEMYTEEELPDKWYCYLNWDLTRNQCDIEEEKEDEGEKLKPTYEKTGKKNREKAKVVSPDTTGPGNSALTEQVLHDLELARQTEENKLKHIKLEKKLLQAEKDKLMQFISNISKQNEGGSASEALQDLATNIGSTSCVSSPIVGPAGQKNKRKHPEELASNFTQDANGPCPPKAVKSERMACEAAVTKVAAQTQTVKVEEDSVEKDQIAELHSKLENAEETVKDLTTQLETSKKTQHESDTMLANKDKTVQELNEKLETVEKTLQASNSTRETTEKMLLELRNNVFKLLRMFGAGDNLNLEEVSKIDGLVANITSASVNSNNDTDDDDDDSDN